DAGFRVEEERAGHDDLFACAQPLDDLDTLAEAPACPDPPSFEHPVSAIDEDSLLATGIEDGIHGNGDRRRQRDRQVDIDKHVRPKDVTRIVVLEPKPAGLAPRIEL